MADLGSIGFSLETPRSTEIDSITNGTTGKLGMSMLGAMATTGLSPGRNLTITSRAESGRLQSTGTYTVCGTVLEEGVARTNWLVRLYRRDNGVWLGDARTDGSGYFEFVVIGYNGEVTCIAYDDATVGVNHNAMVFDRVVPV